MDIFKDMTDRDVLMEVLRISKGTDTAENRIAAIALDLENYFAFQAKKKSIELSSVSAQ